MKRKSRLTAATAAALALSTTWAPVSADKGLGPLYNMKYNSRGISKTVLSSDGKIAMSIEEIDTVNCGGCDQAWLAPGRIFHLRNMTKQPLCVVMQFTRNDSRADYWGSGETHYLKGGQTFKKAGGIYDFSDGDSSVHVDTGFSWSIRTWTPLAKNECA